ncbi:TPA: TrmH family RNA methyltransferase [Candidatus Dojkabacteria bacterium]|uniref:TrmH family RNA methyltransferase n=1 Tax=Candidatus Dojkabacteria bacterium TaxID=2099670 RepID=A0A832RA19_9BACT|nr:TrmH family RNA methyltransferase [Candidatus Dojkabacteria bacterium]
MQLPKLKRYQKKFDFSYAFGAYPVLDLLKFQKEKVLKVLVKKEGLKSDGISEILDICKRENIPFEENDKLIDRIAYKENTYVVGIFEKYEEVLESEKNHIVLVNPSNTGNLGTIIRTMVGFGFKNLAIIKPGVDIFDPMVVRSTMGALFRVYFRYFDSIRAYTEAYKGHNMYPFMLDGAKNILEVEFKEPFSFIQGNEGRGLDDSYKTMEKRNGESIYIPHSDEIDSLNLSVATSIGMWEYGRRK